MSFGSIWLDALFGLTVAYLFGAWLTHRKNRWTGRTKAPGGARPDQNCANPAYLGGMKRPPAPIAPSEDEIIRQRILLRQLAERQHMMQNVGMRGVLSPAKQKSMRAETPAERVKRRHAEVSAAVEESPVDFSVGESLMRQVAYDLAVSPAPSPVWAGDEIGRAHV